VAAAGAAGGVVAAVRLDRAAFSVAVVREDPVAHAVRFALVAALRHHVEDPVVGQKVPSILATTAHSTVIVADKPAPSSMPWAGYLRELASGVRVSAERRGDRPPLPIDSGESVAEVAPGLLHGAVRQVG